MANLPAPYARLMNQLSNELPRLRLLERYALGDAPLPEGAEGMSSAYRAFQKKARTNFAQLAVSAVRERMVIGGFRTGADGDQNGDREVRRLWKANDLDVKAADAHDWMLTFGHSYAIVGPTSAFTGAPIVTIEHPMSMTALRDPIDRRRVVSAMKVYRDEIEELDWAYFYEADRITRYAKPSYSENNFTVQASQTRRELTQLITLGGWDLVDVQPNPLGQVPVVVFENLGGTGEFESHLDILDRINHTVLQRLVITTTQAFKQRAIEGDLPEFDADGNAIDYNGIFQPGPGSLWLMPPGAKIWESGQTDIQGILTAAKNDIQDFAAVTRTPLHYFTPGGESQSAEGATLSREGLVFKTEDRINRVSSAWTTIVSLMFRYAGDPDRANLLDLEPIWESPERYSLAERGDAISKFVDVPFRSRMELVGKFSPAEIDQMETEKASEVLLAGLFAQPEQPTDAPTPPETPTENNDDTADTESDSRDEGQVVDTYEDLSNGDIVEFSEGYGQVEHIMVGGTLGIPGSDFAIETSTTEPGLTVRLWRWEDGRWVATAQSYNVRYSEVTRLDALPDQG